MAEHRLTATSDNTRIGILQASDAPTLTVRPGDEIRTNTLTHWGGRVTPRTTYDEILELRSTSYPGRSPHTLTGPIEIQGAQPGNILRVDFLELHTSRHGFNLFHGASIGTGVLPDEFAEGQLRHFVLDPVTLTTEFASGIRIPLRPFLGFVGVAPSEPGEHRSGPPRRWGGNLDLAALTEGTSLFLPVAVPGAMLSFGDAHAAQGDGEVSVTAIETAMDVVHVRVSLTSGLDLMAPVAETSTDWIAIGLGGTLDEAARQAVRSAIQLMTWMWGVTPSEAYALCSVTVDLGVTQAVNGTLGVHAKVPKDVFSSRPPVNTFAVTN